MAVIYNTQTPIVRGAWVDGMEGVKKRSFNDLILGHGDGVVLAMSA